VILARCIVAVLVATLLVGLPTAAFADPPDPTWIAGYWDDDDFDNAVILITRASAIDDPSPVDARPPLWIPIAQVDLPERELSPTPPRAAASPRAPPVSSPSHH
jgi:hypothetical protein